MGTDRRRVPTARQVTVWADIAWGDDDHTGKRAFGQTYQGHQPSMASLG
jgi:hypothetical protein